MEATQTIDYAIERLQPVFDKLGDLGIAGWEIAVRQQVINGSMTLAISVFLLAFGAGSVYWSMKKAASIDPKNDKVYGYFTNSPGYSSQDVLRSTGIMIVVGFGSLFVGIIQTATTLAHSVTQIFNPQWAAIEALLKLVQ
jgi:hypothetical protein